MRGGHGFYSVRFVIDGSIGYNGREQYILFRQTRALFLHAVHFVMSHASKHRPQVFQPYNGLQTSHTDPKKEKKKTKKKQNKTTNKI